MGGVENGKEGALSLPKHEGLPRFCFERVEPCTADLHPALEPLDRGEHKGDSHEPPQVSHRLDPAIRRPPLDPNW